MSKSTWGHADIPDLTGYVAVVTGSTSGLGKEAARVLAGKNASVVLAVRNVEKGEGVAEAIRKEHPSADVSVAQLDLSSLASVKDFADAFTSSHNRLDLLINNAGVMMCPYAKTAEGFEIQLGTNHLGHFALTGRLLPLLKRTVRSQTEGSRVVNLSSLAHKGGKLDFSDLNWEKRRYVTSRAYGDSKLANLYFTYELARRLGGEGGNPRVTAAHPGWTVTELQRHSRLADIFNPIFGQDVRMGTLPTLRAAVDPKARAGDYYGPSKLFEMQGPPVKVDSNRRSQDPEIARRLWDVSEEMTGVRY